MRCSIVREPFRAERKPEEPFRFLAVFKPVDSWAGGSAFETLDYLLISPKSPHMRVPRSCVFCKGGYDAADIVSLYPSLSAWGSIEMLLFQKLKSERYRSVVPALLGGNHEHMRVVFLP